MGFLSSLPILCFISSSDGDSGSEEEEEEAEAEAEVVEVEGAVAWEVEDASEAVEEEDLGLCMG